MLKTIPIEYGVALAIFIEDASTDEGEPLGTLELDSDGTLWFTDATSAKSIPLTSRRTNEP